MSDWDIGPFLKLFNTMHQVVVSCHFKLVVGNGVHYLHGSFLLIRVNGGDGLKFFLFIKDLWGLLCYLLDYWVLKPFGDDRSQGRQTLLIIIFKVISWRLDMDLDWLRILYLLLIPFHNLIDLIIVCSSIVLLSSCLGKAWEELEFISFSWSCSTWWREDGSQFFVILWNIFLLNGTSCTRVSKIVRIHSTLLNLLIVMMEHLRQLVGNHSWGPLFLVVILLMDTSTTAE
jgi:hypothetical protein